MKKIIAGTVLLFIAAVLITPLFVGIAAEKKINEQISKVSLTTDVTISNIYKRNWFSSNAETSFDLSQILAAYGLLRLDTMPDLGEIKVKTRSEIIHGPFPLKRFYPKQPLTFPLLGVTKNISTITFPPDVLNFTPTITTYTSIYPNGSGSGAFTIPKFNYQISDTGKVLKISEIDGEISFSSDMSKLFFSFNAPKIFFKSLDNEFEVNGLKCSWRNDRDIAGIQSGDFKLIFDNIISGKTKINNCEFSSFRKEEGSNLFFNTSISIKSFKDDNTGLGPVEIELSVKNIKKNAYKQLASLLSGLNNKSENQFAHILMMTQIIGLLPELLSESPEINLKKFEIGTPDGKVSISASIKADEAELINLNDLEGIINSITADFSMIIPNSIAEKYILNNKNPRYIMLQSMMVEDGVNYTLDLKYNDSQFFVNGQPFSTDQGN